MFFCSCVLNNLYFNLVIKIIAIKNFIWKLYCLILILSVTQSAQREEMYISELVGCKRKFHKSYKIINYIYLCKVISHVLNSFIFFKNK